MEVIVAEDLIRLFGSWKVLFADKREELIALDSKVGDSDLGITMNKAFAAAADAVATAGEEVGIGRLLSIGGSTMARSAPSTMGTLTATGFMRAGKALDLVDTIGTLEAAIFWRAFRDAVAERGKAKLGDKTLLDVLDPIAVTLQAQSVIGAPLNQALAAAACSAKLALEATKSLTAQHGKAAAFQETTVGLQDAGATVGVLLVIRMAEFVSSSLVVSKLDEHLEA